MYTHMCVYVYTYTYMHTHTHIHTHIQSSSCIVFKTSYIDKIDKYIMILYMSSLDIQDDWSRYMSGKLQVHNAIIYNIAT